MGEGPSFASNESVAGDGYAHGIPKGFKIAGAHEKLPSDAVTPTAIATPSAGAPFSGIVVVGLPAGTLPVVHTAAYLRSIPGR